MSLKGYGKVRHFGDRASVGIVDGEVIVQEKVDGSQISFGVIDDKLFVSSRGGPLDLDNAGDFSFAVEAIRKVVERLMPDVIYRGEYLRKPKQNVLVYERIPKGHIMVFDMSYRKDNGDWANGLVWTDHVLSLGFEPCPVIFEGAIKDHDHLQSLIQGDSILGGQREGIVVKNYATQQKAKLVCSDFQEVHKRKKTKAYKPSGVDAVIADYVTEARWNKAIQHLRDEGKLTDTMKDIGPLIKEIHADVFEEELENIKNALFDAYSKQIRNALVNGFPQYYKDLISVDVFEQE